MNVFEDVLHWFAIVAFETTNLPLSLTTTSNEKPQSDER